MPAPDTGHTRYGWILDLLPVRHPMVQVDRVVSLEPGVEIVTEKVVSGGEPCFAGVAADAPARAWALPRTLIMESFGQSAALLWLSGELKAPGGEEWLPIAARMRRCDYHGDAFPGDVIRHTVRLETVKDGTTAFLSGSSRIGDRTVFTVGSMTAVRRPARLLDRP
ncbi:3-hydroxyacyl-ACP dehydratase FabZ family protein [Streptomyces pactum]|uniref:3-hydroxyacyl-ACP dehydratase FabZ family protein n=1 Tax=Streptomyces pactum TaxID=68249 RepID=UPI0037001C00